MAALDGDRSAIASTTQVVDQPTQTEVQRGRGRRGSRGGGRRRRIAVHYTCNHQGTVWRVPPSAGTFVAVWSTVDVVIGVRDYRRPCP